VHFGPYGARLSQAWKTPNSHPHTDVFPPLTDNESHMHRRRSPPPAAFPRSIFVIIYLACREAAWASEWRGVCVCVASPLNGTLDAWKITREMSLTFIVAVRRHSACIYGGVSRHYIILHACECVFDIALLKVGLTAGTRGAATYFSWSRRRARIHNNERGVRYHSRLFYAEEIGVCVGKAAHRFCGVSAGLECGLRWKIVFPPLG